MKRTPVGAKFTRQLNTVNDQLCFSMFQKWELEQTLESLAAAKSGEYTPQVFEGNPFSKRIYRKISELRLFSDDSVQVAIRMSVIAGAEYCLAYIEEIEEFRKSLTSTQIDEVRHDMAEEQLRQKVAAWTGRAPEAGYFLTLGFFRLLRNHYAHLNDAPSSAFAKYLRSHAKDLNQFWDNGVTDLGGLDFKLVVTNQLDSNSAFGAMNVMRISLQCIDAIVVETLSIDDAVRSVLQSVPRTRSISARPIEQIVSKIRGQLRAEWGWEVSETDVRLCLEGLGRTATQRD